MKTGIAIFLNEKIESISQIYGVYWRMEKVIQTSLSFANVITSVFSERDICDKLYEIFMRLKNSD